MEIILDLFSTLKFNSVAYGKFLRPKISICEISF